MRRVMRARYVISGLFVLAIVFACAAVEKAATSSYTIENFNWNFANVELECDNGRVLKNIWNIATGQRERGRVAFWECQDVRAHITFVGSREVMMLDLIGWTPEFDVVITIAPALSFTTYHVISR